MAGLPFAARLRALRDLAAAAGALVSRPSPAAPPPRSASPATQSPVAPRALRIAAVVRETSDAVSLVFEDPSGSPMRFAPGQFFTLHVRIGGELQKRAYSASSSALDPDRVSVTIKRVHDGRVSRHLVANARVGDILEVQGPSGAFAPSPADGPRVLVLIGGGSGITPLASIARTLLASEPDTRIALVYGNRGIDDVIFKDALDALVSEYSAHGENAGGIARFVVRHVLEAPPAGWSGGTGRLDPDALSRELDAIGEPDSARVEYFLCGPAPMMTGARAFLEGRGVTPARIREERFVSAHAAAGSIASGPLAVMVRLSGSDHELVVAPGRTVLDTALDAGVDMPFSCTVGGCGTCRVRLTAGTVAMDEPNCLSPQERTEGYVLACVSRPTSPCTIEVP